MSYAATVRDDGTFDVSLILAIAHRRAKAERNLEILCAAGISCPAHVPLGEAVAWEAAAAATVDLTALPGPPPLSYREHLARQVRAVWAIAISHRRRRPRPVAAPAPALR